MTASRHVIAPKRPYVTVKCLHCGGDFTRKHSVIFNKFGTQTRKFCSNSCAVTHRTVTPYFECAMCKKNVARSKGQSGGYNYKQIYCSRSCQHKSLNKGGYVHRGYRYIHIDKAAVLEHRHVMEKEIGRKLFADETVHHIDGNTENNAPSNLELWSSRHPKGQRVEDKIIFARDILSRYSVPVEIFTVSEAARGLMAC
jgi:hypothetical protein